MPSFQLFKPDIAVTSMEGAVVCLSAADLKGIADRYDPTLHEAPIIIGHPEHDAPAYGWVKGLSFADGALAADEQQVDPSFEQLRTQGRFKKVSARFFTPTAKNNPTPGQWYLRDVGFLGAMPPAVKGLKSYSFADAPDQVATAVVSFADLPAYGGSVISRMFRGLRDWLIEKHGKEEADRVLPDWDVQYLQDMSTRAEAKDEAALSFADIPNPHPAPKENPSMKTAEQLQTELDAANKARADEKARADSLEATERKRVTDQRHAENASFADTLVAQARWPAGAKDVLVATLNLASEPRESGVVSFGDGDAAKPLHQVLREQLQALPAQVSFGEFAGKGSGGGGDASPEAVAAAAVAYQADQATKGNTVNTADAVRHVSKKT